MGVAKVIEQKLNRGAGRLIEGRAQDNMSPRVFQPGVEVGAYRNFIKALGITAETAKPGTSDPKPGISRSIDAGSRHIQATIVDVAEQLAQLLHGGLAAAVLDPDFAPCPQFELHPLDDAGAEFFFRGALGSPVRRLGRGNSSFPWRPVRA